MRCVDNGLDRLTKSGWGRDVCGGAGLAAYASRRLVRRCFIVVERDETVNLRRSFVVLLVVGSRQSSSIPDFVSY